MSEKRTCTGTGCPFDTVLKVAGELAEEYVTDRDNTLGGIAVTRAAYEGVVAKLGCEGSGLNQQRQVVCPLEATVMMARGYGVQPWPQNAYAFPLSDAARRPEGAAGNGALPNTGQYL
jgi:hypothetical protein